MKYMSLVVILGFVAFSNPSRESHETTISEEKTQAFDILVNKCNVCHTTDNPGKVFTMDNMNGFAKKINRQVFFWKRMPKGRDIKLSAEEKKALKNWINIVKKNK